MAHTHRFYSDSVSPGAREVLLSPEESHHALHVVRVRPGEAVALFDGCGGLWRGQVARAGRGSVYVTVEGEERVPEPARRLTLAQAWLHRGKAIDFLVQHGTAVGIRRFVFFRGAHSEQMPRRNPKWDRMAIEVC